jgi:hypothetical protein
MRPLITPQAAPVATPTSAPQAGLSRPSGMGGMGGFGPAIQTATPTTVSLDLPQSLASLMGGTGGQVAINEQAIQPLQTGTVASNPNYPALEFRMQPTYADGGMVGADGMPDMTGLGGGAGLAVDGQQGGITPQMVEMQIQDFIRNNKQVVQEFQQVVAALVRSGDLTPEELNMAEQLASTAMQNPDMYQYIRKFAIEQGLANEEDLSPQYDEGIIIAVLIAVRAAKAELGGNALESQAPMMSMADGGYVTMGENAKDGGPVAGPGTTRSDSIPIRVSTGEYVIPAHVVKLKGKEFFDTMLDKYKDQV